MRPVKGLNALHRISEAKVKPRLTNPKVIRTIIGRESRKASMPMPILTRKLKRKTKLPWITASVLPDQLKDDVEPEGLEIPEHLRYVKVKMRGRGRTMREG